LGSAVNGISSALNQRGTFGHRPLFARRFHGDGEVRSYCRAESVLRVESFGGLFGGILATSVQAQHEPAAVQRERAIAALRELNEDLRNAHKALSNYQHHAPSQIEATRAGMAEGKAVVLFERFYYPQGFAPPNNGQACTQAVIDVEEERLALTLKIGTRSRPRATVRVMRAS